MATSTKRARPNAIKRLLKRAEQLAQIQQNEPLPVLLEAIAEHPCPHCGNDSMAYQAQSSGAIVIYCTRIYCKVKPVGYAVD